MLGTDYWVERNFNQDKDVSILALAPRMEEELAQLKSDPQLAQLHADTVAWRHQRFETLMKQEPFRALFGRLLMTPPTRAVPLNEARFLVGYANLGRQENPEAAD
jgi:hypothetical protein